MANPPILLNTAANWTFNNPILEEGQLGVESDVRNSVQTGTVKAKMGDGVSNWTELDYWTPNAGNVVGAASSTDNAIARFDGTTGKIIQNSLMTVDDTGIVNIPIDQSYNINGAKALSYSAVSDFVAVNEGIGASSTRIYGTNVFIGSALTTYFDNVATAFVIIDTGIGRVAEKVAKITDGSTELGWLQDAGKSRVTGNITNGTDTPSNITGLSATLIAGRHYSGKLVLFVSNTIASDGSRVDFDGGAATATDFRAMGSIGDTISVRPLAMTTALATDLVDSPTTGSSIITIEFFITCDAAGTFIPRFAMKATSTGVLTLFRGSYMILDDVS